MKKIYGFILFFIITLVAGEVYIRSTRTFSPPVMQLDPELGRDFKPDTEVMLLSESFYLGGINKYGYSGSGYPEKKQENTLRIALIGDSFVQGHYMAEKFYMGTYIKNILKKNRHQRVEVMNFGTAGIDFRRAYIIYKLKIRKYKPDITLFYVDNGDLFTEDDNFGPECYIRDNKVEIDTSFSKSNAYKAKEKLSIFKNLALYTVLHKTKSNIVNNKYKKILLGKLAPSEPKKQNKLHLNKKLIRLNKMIFSELAGISDKEQRIIFILKKETDKFYKDVLRENYFDFVDLAPLLKNMKKRGHDPYFWKVSQKKGHWNFQAHKEIGTFIGIRLSKILKY